MRLLIPLLVVFLIGCNGADSTVTPEPRTQLIDGNVTRPGHANGTDEEKIPVIREVVLSCAAQDGDVCSMGEECDGYWIEAADTFSCCSRPCVSASKNDSVETPVMAGTRPKGDVQGSSKMAVDPQAIYWVGVSERMVERTGKVLAELEMLGMNVTSLSSLQDNAEKHVNDAREHLDREEIMQASDSLLKAEEAFTGIREEYQKMISEDIPNSLRHNMEALISTMRDQELS